MMVCIGATIGKVAINHKDVCFNQQINSLLQQRNMMLNLYIGKCAVVDFRQKLKKKQDKLHFQLLINLNGKALIFLPENLKEQINIRTKLRMLSDEIDSYIKVKSQKLIELNKLISIILVNELQTKELA